MSIFTKASNASFWRGFDYYESNLVKDVKKIGDGVYTAKVEGSKTYNVKVDLNHPLNSTCTCPFVEGNKKMCKHMIALAFAVSPNDVKEAKKIRDDYYYEQAHKEERLEKIMKKKRAEIKNYVNSLSAKEAKERLYNVLINEEYDEAYKEIYDEPIEVARALST